MGFGCCSWLLGVAILASVPAFAVVVIITIITVLIFNCKKMTFCCGQVHLTLGQPTGNFVWYYKWDEHKAVLLSTVAASKLN